MALTLDARRIEYPPQGNALVLKGRLTLEFVEALLVRILSEEIESCINPQEVRFPRLPAVGLLLRSLPMCTEPKNDGAAGWLKP